MNCRLLLSGLAVLLIAFLSGCPKPPVNSTSMNKMPAVGTPAGMNTEAAGKTGQALTVFAGSASKPALEELAASYKTKTGITVDVTFGGSGAVLTQFAQEQYGDVYVPGSDDFMDKAEKKDAVLKDSRKALVYLVPVINVAKGNPKGVKGLEDFTRKDLRVVIGEPEAVCLGDIGVAVLSEVGLWEKVKPNIASYANNCEGTLNALLLGEADVIVGWDVFTNQQSDKVESISLAGNKAARSRNIPAAVIKWSKQPDAARDFVEYLASDENKPVWEKHGYTTNEPKS